MNAPLIASSQPALARRSVASTSLSSLAPFVLAFALALLSACSSSSAQDADPVQRTPIADGAALAQYILQTEPQLSQTEREARMTAALNLKIPTGVALYGIVYEVDGLQIRGFLAEPQQAGRLPAIIYNRGGNRDRGSLTSVTASNNLSDLATIASWGYVVIASQYCGGGGSQGVDHFGGADVYDVKALVPILGRLPTVDPTRLGMFGWSRGTMMTFVTLKNNDIPGLKAVALGGVDVDQVTMLEVSPNFDQIFTDMDPEHYLADKAAWLSARSVIDWPEAIPSRLPILLVDGQWDSQTPVRVMLPVVNLLTTNGNPLRLVIFEGGDHGVKQHRAEMLGQVRSWMDRFVRDGETPPSRETPAGPPAT